MRVGENLGHALVIAFSIFMFVFALSYAVLTYHNLNDNANRLIAIFVENRRGTIASTQSNHEEGNNARKTDYGEIVLSALNLPKTIMTNGNTQILVQTLNQGDWLIFTDYDSNGNQAIYVERPQESGSKRDPYYFTDYIYDKNGEAVSVSSNSTINKFVEYLSERILHKNMDYLVRFTENRIIYSENG